jgi:hypothetical protein
MSACDSLAINLTPWFGLPYQFPRRPGTYELRLRDVTKKYPDWWIKGVFYARWDGERFVDLRQVGYMGCPFQVGLFDEWRGVDRDLTGWSFESTPFGAVFSHQ